MKPEELDRLRMDITGYLLEMESMFKPHMKLTFVARDPNNPECIVFVSSDDLNDMMRDVKAQLEKS